MLNCKRCGEPWSQHTSGRCPPKIVAQWDISTAATPQPSPQSGGVEIAPLVYQDIAARVEAGERKYGTKLQAHNGRDALMDAYQEAIDLVMYLRQAIEERHLLGMEVEP